MVMVSPGPQTVHPSGPALEDNSDVVRRGRNLSPAESSSVDSNEAAPTEPVYCICRKPDDGKLMVQCDKCMEWFHAACVKLSVKSDLSHWLCPHCSPGRLAKSPSPLPPPRPLSKSKPAVAPVKSNNTTPKAKHSISQDIAQSNNTVRSQNTVPRTNSVKISPITKMVKSVSIPDIPLNERIYQDRTSCRGALAKIVSNDLAHRIEEAAFPSDPTADTIKIYKMKVREIILNLKSNPDLMRNVVEGAVAPMELATKNVSSLAAPDLIAARNEQRQISIISRLVNPVEEEPESAIFVPSSVPEHVVDIVVPDVVNLPPALETVHNDASDSDVSAPIAYDAYKEEHMDNFTEIVKPPAADWTGTLAMSPSDAAFSLSGLVLNPELKSDRRRFSKLAKSLYIHGRVEPSSVHKFLLQVHNITRGMKGSERFNHKRPALVTFHVDEKETSACNNFIKGYADRSRVPVIDNAELGILLYFISPVFDSNVHWAALLQEMFDQSTPPEGAILWAIAIITAESKLNKASSSSSHHRHHHHHRSRKEHSRTAPAAVPIASAAPAMMQLELLEHDSSTGPTMTQLENLEHALAEVDSLTKLVDPRLDPSSWRNHDSYAGPGAVLPPEKAATYKLNPHEEAAIPYDAYRAQPHRDSEYIHPDRAARMFAEAHDLYRTAPRYTGPDVYHPQVDPNIFRPEAAPDIYRREAGPDPYYWAPQSNDRYGPARGSRIDWSPPYRRPSPPLGRMPSPKDHRLAGPSNGKEDHRSRRRHGRDNRRNRGRFPPDRR